MTLNEYQDQALKTSIYPDDMSIIYQLIGLSGEVGELAEKIKKTIRDNNKHFDVLKRAELAIELGDVLWYVAAMASDIGYTIEDVGNINLTKTGDRNERGTLHGSGDYR